MQVEIRAPLLGKAAGKGKKGSKGCKACEGCWQEALPCWLAHRSCCHTQCGRRQGMRHRSVAPLSVRRVTPSQRRPRLGCAHMDLSRLLSGEPLGRHIWGAGQTLEAMEKRGNVGHEYICLKSHVMLAKWARDLQGTC